MKKYGWILYKLAMSLMITYLSFRLIEHFFIYIRGYYAVGGEFLFSVAVGVLLYRYGVDKWNEWLTKIDKEAKEKWKKKSEEIEKTL